MRLVVDRRVSVREPCVLPRALICKLFTHRFTRWSFAGEGAARHCKTCGRSEMEIPVGPNGKTASVVSADPTH